MKKHVVSNIITTGKIIRPTLLESDFEYLSKTFKKIEKSEFEKKLVMGINWLEKESTSKIEEFLCKWISFNILYRIISPTGTDTESIRNTPKLFPDYKKLKNLLEENKILIHHLINLKIISDSDEEYSKLLSQSFKNNKVKETWSYLFLCIYVIRSRLFHKGDYDEWLLWKISRLFETFIPIFILNII